MAEISGKFAGEAFTVRTRSSRDCRLEEEDDVDMVSWGPLVSQMRKEARTGSEIL
jgi:hypothetical protein